MLKGIYHSLTFRLGLFGVLTVAGTYFAMTRQWEWFILVFIGWLYSIRMMSQLYKRNAQKVAFMFDAIDNSDYAFQYATRGRSSNDKLVSESLNRITQILFQAKAEAVQKEKYYELIMNSVNTGIIVLDDIGNIYQTNNEALRLLGLSVFTHVKQLARIDEKLQTTIANILPGDKHQISFVNERGTVNLSIRVSEMTLQEKHVRILAINDINSELDDKEIDSWIRLTRVLTHEIMNSITPIISLTELLAKHADSLEGDEETKMEIRQMLQTIGRRGNGLVRFMNSYREVSHLPHPLLKLYNAGELLKGVVQLMQNDTDDLHLSLPNVPLRLIADKEQIEQVLINLIRNARENEATQITLSAGITPGNHLFLRVTDNGTGIDPEVQERIFIPFFTTKPTGSGIGLTISRQIMHQHHGSITVQSKVGEGSTFTLLFPIV